MRVPSPHGRGKTCSGSRRRERTLTPQHSYWEGSGSLYQTPEGVALAVHNSGEAAGRTRLEASNLQGGTLCPTDNRLKGPTRIRKSTTTTRKLRGQRTRRKAGAWKAHPKLSSRSSLSIAVASSIALCQDLEAWEAEFQRCRRGWTRLEREWWAAVQGDRPSEHADGQRSHG